MSRLRSQIHSAKNAYARVSYPGNLSAEVLGPLVPHHWYKWPARLGFGGLVVAAAVAWVVLLSRPVIKPAAPPPHVNEDQHDLVAKVPKESLGLPLSPPGMPDMPAMPDLSAMPALPAVPAGFTGSAVPAKAPPSIVPDMAPLEPPGFPPTFVPAVSNNARIKEPA